MKSKLGDAWRDALKSWGIPSEILDQAPTNPWIHPVELFQVPEEIANTPSHQKAREVNPTSVLDVGCGGGLATFALVPPATKVIGVDHQVEMLQEFEANASKRHVESETHLGIWPEISEQVPTADVVVCHHVLFNVFEIEKFLIELDAHAKKRVVIEIPVGHPQSSSNYLWKHFWGINRPENPKAAQIVEILDFLGISASIVYWTSDARPSVSEEKAIEFNRVRLCLNQSKDLEIAQIMKEQPETKRELATIWWDK
jgi:SAM-dependent methyltransferase